MQIIPVKKLNFRLQTRISILVCMVVAVSLLVTGILIGHKVAENTQQNIANKAMNIARIVAHSQLVIQAMDGKKDQGVIQTYANEIMHLTNVEYVVVFDMNTIRLSHPDPDEIGKRFVGGDEGPVLQGKEYVSTAKGTLGMSLRAFAPVFDPSGKQLGAVAVGVSLNEVGQDVAKSSSIIYIGTIFGILVGVLGAIVLARKIKKIMFGMEPIEIAKLLEERSAMLQSTREGIIFIDQNGQITLINNEALRLLKIAGITSGAIGEHIENIIPSSRMHEVLQTGAPELDQEVELNGISLFVNRVPVRVEGSIVGVISTFRDKTELKRMAEELSGVRIYAEALRTQAHEFMNKLHVISGMIQLERYNDLTAFITKIAAQHQTEIGFMVKRIKDPVLAGFILGKLSYAREVGAELVFSPESYLPEPQNPESIHELVTVFGNLIDNALEAVAMSPNKLVHVYFNYELGVLTIEINDTGPGIDEEIKHLLFTKGFSTKGENRGVGLFLVQRSIEKLNGSIQIISGQESGTIFKVEIPYAIKYELV